MPDKDKLHLDSSAKGVPWMWEVTARVGTTIRRWAAIWVLVAAGLMATPAVGSEGNGSLASAASASKKKAKTSPAKRPYCSKRRRTRCVKVPAGARRPRGVSPQGVVPTDTPNAGGIGGDDDPAGRRREALAWAKTQLGQTRWAWRCERFVEVAYGTSDQFPSAAAAAAAAAATRALKDRTAPQNAPAGALMYFAKSKYNRNFGHVGISLGDGRMISALRTVSTTNVRRSAYWRNLYRGWTDPSMYPGRIPPPPFDLPSFDQNASVRVTAPASGAIVGGDKVELMATANGAADVVFDAYYATDPADPTTRKWHQLGSADPEDGAWKFVWDATTIPGSTVQPSPTVTIAAIIVDAQGRRSAVRGYRRVLVDNVKPPQIEPLALVITVDNRVTNGLGMREDSTAVRLTTKPWTYCGSRGCNINGTERSSGGTYDAAVCQTVGERTTNGHDGSSADDANPELYESTRYYGVRLGNGTFGYVSEVWIRAADRGGLGLPNC